MTLPLDATQDWTTALEAMGGAVTGQTQPAAIALWKPSENSELADMEGIDPASMGRLRLFAREQLFGIGRRPVLIVTRGTEAPLVSAFNRKEQA